jgi:hypothetical protein
MNLSTVLNHPLVTTLLNLSQAPILITDRFTTEILFANAASTQLFGEDYTSRKIEDDRPPLTGSDLYLRVGPKGGP